ncbi:carbohydrate ABC transporter permease [Paenibacillus piri]|uniref:Carbohydrate ABC transporter permease n=1 Tax=Paenibacillus piri TaxID=2547395 RepID=A0A4R5KX30_9BACL|nr:carbohydrate ABC transporter permease [Paenibacillus piri]TDG00584.1 carbohydrate ABC transporter permease [Paenibacillus piri]
MKPRRQQAAGPRRRKNVFDADHIFGACNLLFLTIITLVTLLPVIAVLLSSVTPMDDVIKHPSSFIVIPSSLTFDYYAWLFRGSSSIIDAYTITILRTLVGTAISLALTIVTAYPLSKKFLPGRGGIMSIFFFTMLFSGGIIPTFLIVNGLHLTNSFWALIIPSALSVYNLIIMRTFFQTIPIELEESAYIDGASEMTTLLRIVLPVSLPSLATISLFYAVFHWNAFFDAVMYITNRKLWPLQLILREILVKNDIGDLALGGSLSEVRPPSSVLINTTIVVAVLPIMCVYPFLQRYFIQGMMVGSIKG